MKTFKQSGEVLPVIAPYDVQRGSGVLIGQLFGLACATVNAGTSVDIMCKGEFVVDKVTTEAWAVGDKIYWNSSSKKFSNVGGGGLLVGLASESAVNPSLLGSLLLTQQPGLVDPVFNAVTGVVSLLSGGRNILGDMGVTHPRPQLVTVVCGNSIMAQSKWNSESPNAVAWKAQIHVANALSGSPLRFRRITSGTRIDSYGVYGYGGQTLAGINADLETNFFAPLRTASIVPDLVVGGALLENDIVGGATYAQCVSRLQCWIMTMQATWPGVRLLISTPHPSFAYNTAAMVLVYQQIRDYILLLDDGRLIFVSRADGYENPNSPATPIGTSGAPIYTDSSVHPNRRGALVIARQIASTLRRMNPDVALVFSARATNPALIGSASASGTNVTGTVPTSGTITGSASGTFVSLAGDPGWDITFSNNTPGLRTDLNTFNIAQLGSLSGIAEIAPFLKVALVSGAENLRCVQLEARVLDGGGNTFRYFLQDQSPEVDAPGFQNGDVLTLVYPQIAANSGAISGVQTYIRAIANDGTTSQITIRILNHGFLVIA